MIRGSGGGADPGAIFFLVTGDTRVAPPTRVQRFTSCLGDTRVWGRVLGTPPPFARGPVAHKGACTNTRVWVRKSRHQRGLWHGGPASRRLPQELRDYGGRITEKVRLKDKQGVARDKKAPPSGLRALQILACQLGRRICLKALQFGRVSRLRPPLSPSTRGRFVACLLSSRALEVTKSQYQTCLCMEACAGTASLVGLAGSHRCVGGESIAVCRWPMRLVPSARLLRHDARAGLQASL